MVMKPARADFLALCFFLLNIFYCIPGEGHMGSGFPPAEAIKRKRK